jgi:hypothetical protein
MDVTGSDRVDKILELIDGALGPESPFTDPPAPERDRGFSRHTFYSLNTGEWLALLRFYRILRIRIPYGPPGSARLDGERANGCSYGMTRDEARGYLRRFAVDLDWYAYLGSK